MPVPILKQGSYLIASVQSALTDAEWRQLQKDLLVQVGKHHSRGVIIDVAALDVIDSFATRTLRNLAQMTRLRGADTVIVGLQPEATLGMVQLGLARGLEGVKMALDLEEGLALLAQQRSGERGR